MNIFKRMTLAATWQIGSGGARIEPGRLNKRLFAIVQVRDIVVAWLGHGNGEKWSDSEHRH